MTVPQETGQEPYGTPEDHPALAASAAAMEDGFGRPAGRMGNAGGGAAERIAGALGVPVVFFGTGLLEERWHGSDERASIEVLHNGAARLAHLWPRLAQADLARGAGEDKDE